MEAQTVRRQQETYTVVLVPSSSNPSKVYRVDVVNQRCSCPGWVFQRGERKLCKHLKALGFKPTVAQLKLQFDEVL